MKRFVLALLFVLVAGRNAYDARGNYRGRISYEGPVTRYYNQTGRYVGRAATDPNGTTRFYDARGNRAGSIR